MVLCRARKHCLQFTAGELRESEYPDQSYTSIHGRTGRFWLNYQVHELNKLRRQNAKAYFLTPQNVVALYTRGCLYNTLQCSGQTLKLPLVRLGIWKQLPIKLSTLGYNLQRWEAEQSGLHWNSFCHSKCSQCLRQFV